MTHARLTWARYASKVAVSRRRGFSGRFSRGSASVPGRLHPGRNEAGATPVPGSGGQRALGGMERACMVVPNCVRPHVGLEVTPSIRLLRPVGAGGMGSVWVAHHAGLETNVAVKFLLADLTVSEGALLRFTDEASVAAQVKSPHVVQVYDHGILDGELPFIVMEFLEGQDLGARVTRRGTLDLATTAILVQQLGQVLAKAHAAGIVHRDIKPENVFLL